MARPISGTGSRYSSNGSKCRFNAPIPSLAAVKPQAVKSQPVQTLTTNLIDDFDADKLIELLTASQSAPDRVEGQARPGKRKADDAGLNSGELRRHPTGLGVREGSEEIAQMTDPSDEYDPEIDQLFNSPTDSTRTTVEDAETNGGSGRDEVSSFHGIDTTYEGVPASDTLTPPYEDVEFRLSQSEECGPQRSPQSQAMLPTPSPPPSAIALAQQSNNSLVASIDVLKMEKNIAEVKSRILSTHSVITTYTAMKSAYIQVCTLSKSLTRQLALARRRISELEHKNSQLAGKLNRSNAKVEELKGIIRSLPDQGEVLRNIAQLEMDNIKKSKEIQRLHLKYGERDDSTVNSGQ
ncbi:hypothetical protein POJ06DRAFT_149352 [Lipomyces tetrasporus]|uniref:Uncharacterized protein n=1 Tax=Lipomyces tetrasporus TaxID=54092 RepID=A0AAD7QN78_9ASCO|nr:uncharacterized protein POJ06DRAFT_149352 [Lipomyces tetrasporus]KAJ8098323.1 hypothetical protein POJ06DRAFT_149352 [Lipomyces tetrasporus]